jgi:hypothetical protein
MKKIPLTQGYFAIVDDSDFDMLNRVKWHANKGHNTFYAQRSVLQENGKWKNVQMHRVILGVHDPKIQVDHINGDGLDNRRCNLRSCTRSENMQNQQIHKNNTSGRKGVHWNSNVEKFHAQIAKNGKRIYLGLFNDLESAAKAYDKAALLHHKGFAHPNHTEK